ncbi:PqiC family protein [Azohydromonas lata]|uniref:ABC-type transport auxiliary lipoprotein family protein n=1 Tax=Azohydromonas lata TaxID=45677 RepID=A0ABU5IGF0_9BURK|nr:ABC-type transport auxiliary lipoprotein family protein [Azohydromonas lata]MDZ5458207.1 ABC-type transport auxiliary lipoprotein family protein [Azohydromonas lata]
MTTSACRAAAVLSLSAVLLGCASAPPSARLLALPTLGEPPAGAAAPAVQAAQPEAAPAAGPVLVVRRVQLPEYLLARRVRYRAADTTVDDWPGTFWAERIEVGMTRELASELRARLPLWTLCNATCNTNGDGGTEAAQPRAHSLRLEFSPLDYRRDRHELVAVVRGSLEAPDGTPLQRLERRYVLSAGADTPQAHAQVLGELLRRVAADVVPLAAAVSTAPAAPTGQKSF